jgi:hypothetical protein
MAQNEEIMWFDDYAEEADDVQVEEYDITAAPNDFNVLTIYSFLESGAVRIPGSTALGMTEYREESTGKRVPG